ncbi:hypothetical protein [Succinatimonas hippei]|uniref:hypothetical protein n=1 Tax=Succinatimonas hippei TaxID=626938 RepID=UPI00255D1534|nr:hypothetical protein [Succinatimonas hippei]
MHYIVKIFVIAFIFMLVSSRFTSFLPRFSEVTVADVQNEITAIEKFTQKELKEKHEIIAKIKENIKKNKNKKLHKYEEPSDECYTDLVYVRLVLTFKAVWQKALIFAALAMVIFNLKKDIDVSRHRSPYPVKFTSSLALIILSSFILFLAIQTRFDLVELMCVAQAILIMLLGIKFIYNLGFKTL